jgi:FkbM family methyltransferase
MQQFDAWWFPDGETQLPEAMAAANVRVAGRLTWQHHKYAAACGLCTALGRKAVAVDIGAHVGLLSYYMAKDFAHVFAFEPVAAHAECWRANMGYAPNVRLYERALGSHQGSVALTAADGQSGGAHVDVTAVDTPRVEMDRLDDYDLWGVDLLKIDVEGYEPHVLAGARRTLLQRKPVILIEQHIVPHHTDYGFAPTAAVDYLLSLGAAVRTQLGSDFILWWP